MNFSKKKPVQPNWNSVLTRYLKRKKILLSMKNNSLATLLHPTPTTTIQSNSLRPNIYCHTDLLGFSWVSPSFTGFYRVLPSFTEFDWVFRLHSDDCGGLTSGGWRDLTAGSSFSPTRRWWNTAGRFITNPRTGRPLNKSRRALWVGCR